MPDDATLPLGRFVGRAKELHEIDRACKSATHGRGALVVVSGEAGIGKTRLCDEAAARAGSQGLRVVTSRCWVAGGAPPLWPWQPILAELCGADAAALLAADGGTGTVDLDRFARFVAVTDQLGAACEAMPVCLVIDDVQAADSGTLLLTRFVARSLPRLRLALVLSRRTGALDDRNDRGRRDERDRLLDEIEREATAPLVLGSLDLVETTEFLSAHGLEGDADLVQALVQVTGGNPLFLRRITARGVPDPGSGLPAGLHAAIDAAVEALAPKARQILQTGAVLGQAPTLTETAALSGTTAAEVLDAVADAASAGLVGLESADRFAFTHELVRAALEDHLPPADRLDAHAGAAAVIAGATTPEGLARRAYHLLQAAPRSPDDARRAVDGCRAAAGSMIQSFAFEQADILLSAAVDLHVPATLGPAPGALLVEWSEAALLCGRLGEARVRFDRAAVAAEDEGDPQTFADAALGMGGVWLNERRDPVERTRVLSRQRTALARLPEEHAGRRSRLEVRLAAEATYDGEPLEPVLRALEAARRSGDHRALAEALSLTHHAMLAPEHAHDRVKLANELIRVASEAGLGVLSLMGLCWRAVDLFLVGDAGALRALEDLRERAETVASENILYLVDVLDVMLLIRAGRLDEAAAAATAAYSRGHRVGDVDGLGYMGAHMHTIRWIQGRDAELNDLAAEIASSPTLVQAEFGFRATAAALAARSGSLDRARAALDHLTADGLAGLPRSSTWLVGMVAIIEAGARLGDVELLREAYDLLVPYADLPAMPSLAVACLGSTHRALGVAAGTFGDLEKAVDHLERAVVANRLLGNRPLVAISQADLAQALLLQGAPDGLKRAGDMLPMAVGEATAMGMTGRVDEWREHLAQLGTPKDGGSEQRHRPFASPTPQRGIIRRQGRDWVIGIGDRQAVVGELVGMGYLAELLTHPGQPISALRLAAAGGPAPTELSRQEVLDEAARAAYVSQSRDLAEELAEAEAHNDVVRAAELRANLAFLLDHIEDATGLAGRSRAFTSPGERARTAVRKAIKRAIDQIETTDPDIAQLLNTTIRTGSTCSYTDDPDQSVHWSTTR